MGVVGVIRGGVEVVRVHRDVIGMLGVGWGWWES